MPLHGKIVVIKRSGGDGTEFPLTASCLFGRKPDCDIRIQLPQVSKEHCRIDLNENKEVTLTNLSSVNPTRINGEVMKQAERLKHGDIITIIDRSFRFEYPPEPTPKKRRPSAAGKSETLQVIHNQQVREQSTEVTGEKRKSLELTSEKSCLKDGTNTSNLQAHPVKDCEDVGRESITGTVEESKPSEMEKLSPICELYQMMKQNLNAKSPWKPAEAGQPRTPVPRNEAQKTMGTEETDRTESTALNAQSTPLSKKVAKQKRNSSIGGKQHLVSKQTEDVVGGEATPQSSKRNSKRSSLKVSSSEGSELSLRVNSDSALPAEQEDSSKPVATPKETPKKSKHSLQSPAKQAKTPTVPEDKGTPTSQKKLHQGTPQRFSAGEVVRQIVSENGVAVETCQSAEKSKTPKGRRSKESGSAVLPLKMFAVTPGTPTGSYFPDSPVVHNLKQEQSDEAETPKKISAEKSPKAKEAVSPLRVSPRKSPGKKLQAADVLLELEMAAPSSGRKAVNAGNRPPSGKRKSGELERDLPAPQLKRKRVSFGGQLSPELFDKRLPPNSPLRKGATPGRRSLSLLKQSVLRGSSTVDLIEEQGTEMSSPKLKTAQRSPGKTASPKTVSGTPSPAKKSPKTKPKTPSPKNTQKSPTSAKTPPSARGHSPKEEPRTPKGKKSDTPSAKTPSPASSTKKTQAKDQSSVTLSRKSPVASAKKPANDLVPADTEGTLSTPAKSTSNGKRSFSNASTAIQSPAEVLKTPLPAQMASSSFAKTPSPSSSNQTPTVRGRFSVSRISTPSPVADEDKGATEMSECVTPRIPMRRKSMKSTSKKTPKSARKSVLDVMRSRRSGASKANLKVVRSFADIVKFGISKPQVDVPIKKLKTTVTVKKSVVKKPKTPAKKIKEHFSTGHAASPATIVVGKAHKTITQVVGGAPKLVHNVALLRKNMDMNEDLTGIAEIFHTPATVREKRIRTSGKVCPETPQTAAALIEVSVMDTPEETGEMVVSPLSVVGTAKRERFNREAVSRLLQEDQDSSLIGVDAPQESANALTVPLISAENAEEQISVKGTRTPKQKLEPLTGLTGVKRLMKTPKQKAQQVEVEDLRGLKRLLKTPKEPKMSQEASLVGVKEMLKTPKPLKGQPVEDMVGVQRMMKTPKVQKPPVMCITGVKRLLRTPKEKVESGEDLTGVKQLMKTPKQKREPVEDMIGLKQMMQTPKQKVESVEDLTGVKELMKTPKQKGEPVEDMIGLKRMMQTPKQKVESVEDLTGVKELMKTPKQKGQPVENKFGISKLMKSPRQRGGAAIEDFVGLQELMEEPADYAFAKVGIQNDIEISEEKVSISKCEKTLSDACDANMASKDELKLEENQSETPKKPVRGRRQKRVDNGSAADTKESASVGSQGDAEMNNTVDTDQTFSGVKPKRGKQARQITAAVRTPRRKITEIKEKVISPTVVAPVKSTRGKRAKNMEESNKGTTDEKPCEDVGSVVLCDEVKSMQAEIMETAVVHAPAKGRRRMKIEGTPQKHPTPTPVRITGRGRKAKETNGGHVSDDSIKVECIETPPEHKTIDVPEKLSSPEPIMKPRRGRKPKQPHEDHVTAVENAERDVSEPDKPDIENVVPKSDIGKSLQETEEQAPVVKSGRGRKAKAVVEKEPLEVPPKRSRRIAVDLPAQTVASPIPALKSGRGRGRKAQNLDSTEEVIPIKADASSAECPTEPPKKTRGTRKTAKVSDAVSPLESISAPVHTEGGDALPETSVSNDLVKNVQGKTSRRGRIANGKARVSEADEKAEIKTSDVKESGKKASSSKSVNWSSDLAMSHTMEVGEVSRAEGGSQQSKPNKEESASGFSEPAGNKGTETEVTSEPQTKSRRGRPGKKSAVQPTESSLVTEHDDPEPSARKAASSRRGKMQATHPVSDPTKDDAPVAKRGLKRKATSKDVEKETAVDEPVSESVNIESLPKKARGRAAKVEEVKVEASTPSRARRGTAKKAGKALEVEETKPKQEVETPKPAGRGRRKAAQQAEVEPEPTHEMCPTKGKGEKETSKEKGIAVRGKPKTQTKVESTTESRPVRRTRRN